MSKKADLIKRSAASLASLSEFQAEAPRVYPLEESAALRPASAPPPPPASAPPPPPASVALRAEEPAAPSLALDKVTPPPAREKRRPGRPPPTVRMIPLGSRVQDTKKQTLTELSYRTNKTETALLDEALDLLFKRYSKMLQPEQ